MQNNSANYQSLLAEYCRTDEYSPIPGVDPQKVNTYRRLVFNVILDSLQTAYPITKKILSDDEWKQITKDFFASNKCSTPLIWKMPYEFYEFAADNNYTEKFNKPYLDELLLFEWLEIEVHTMPDMNIRDFRPVGDVLEDQLVVNPEFRFIKLTYPVHKMRYDRLKDEAGEYFLLVYREQESGKVKFFSFSAFTALVFNYLANDAKNGRKALTEAGKAAGIDNEEQVIQHGIPFLNNLVLQGIILGSAV